MEYIIYSDESDSYGKFYGNFYGAALVRSKHLKVVEDNLSSLKREHNLNGEIKWSKTPSHPTYLDRYKIIIDKFFEFIEKDYVKIRIFFTQNRNVPQNLTSEQIENQFCILYYQFLKHAFGLKYSDDISEFEKIKLRFYFDDLPISQLDATKFKTFLFQHFTRHRDFGAHYLLNYDDLAEVSSKKHVILQCLDIILGAMCFRLNNKHKEIPPGQKRRAKGTIAKEDFYNHIRGRINEIHPNFNIGVSTGDRGVQNYYWKHSYSHWLFVPTDHRIDFDAETKIKKPRFF